MDENRPPSAPDSVTLEDDSGREARKHPDFTADILSALAHEHRRAIVAALLNAPGTTLEYDALVDSVAARIEADDADRSSAEARQRLRIGLHHLHLPKLQAAGIVDFEAEPGSVQFVGDDLVQDLMTLVESHDSSES